MDIDKDLSFLGVELDEIYEYSKMEISNAENDSINIKRKRIALVALTNLIDKWSFSDGMILHEFNNAICLVLKLLVD